MKSGVLLNVESEKWKVEFLVLSVELNVECENCVFGESILKICEISLKNIVKISHIQFISYKFINSH